MSNSPLVNYTKISPNKTVMSNKVNKKIVIHHMAGNLSVESCGELFMNPAKKGSSNYGIGSDGRVGMYVEEKDRSWCSGSKSIDQIAITIEVADSKVGNGWQVSDIAYNKLIELCVDICKRNGIKALTWTGDKNGTLVCHYMYQATDCPGNYLKERMGVIAKEVTDRLNDKVPTPVNPTNKTIVTYTSHRIENDKWGSEIVGYNEVNSMGYSGSFGKTLDKIAVKLSQGTITYTVHRNGDWGGEIHGYSTTDTKNYAGSSNKPIDAVAIKAEGINGVLKYRVHRKLDNKWGNWITGYSKTDTKNYAGSFGKEIDAIQIGIE